MPGRRARFLLPLLVAACTPSRFVWDGSPTELDAYLESFAAAAGTKLDERVPYEAMLDRLRTTPLMWFGDHHRSERLHAAHRELLLRLADAGPPLAIVLEAIATQDDAAVESYLRGERTMDDLRAVLRARWPGSWLDGSDVDAPFYRDVLALARARGIPVFGLEPAPRGPIDRRDDAIAERIRTLVSTRPHHRFVVVVGQAHLKGRGDLIARTGLPGIAFGGEPPQHLRTPASARTAGAFWRSDGGLWWFGELLAPAR